jgi:hypothetical protein
MKRENLDKCRILVNRITNMEEALKSYHSYKDKEQSPFRLFIMFFKRKHYTSLDVGYKHDYDIGLSSSQQDELAKLMEKWIKEDKEILETL